jgi:hypothetical protein
VLDEVRLLGRLFRLDLFLFVFGLRGWDDLFRFVDVLVFELLVLERFLVEVPLGPVVVAAKRLPPAKSSVISTINPFKPYFISDPYSPETASASPKKSLVVLEPPSSGIVSKVYGSLPS